MRSTVSIGAFVAALGEAHEFLERQRGVGLRRSGRRPRTGGLATVVRQRRRIRRELFPAPTFSARARRPRFVQREVPELARQRIGTVKQLAVEQQPDANPF